MKTTNNAPEEARIAQEILSVLPAGTIARVCSDERSVLRYSVVADSMKLRSVVFNRESLRRLQNDPARAVKIEYLQRDLAGSAARRAEFRYPRTSRIGAVRGKAQRLRMALAAVAALR